MIQEFGCYFCAGTGYEDYPSNHKPCRIPTHESIAIENIKRLMPLIRRNWQKDDGICPFCKEKACSHWTGFGWKNPKME